MIGMRTECRELLDRWIAVPENGPIHRRQRLHCILEQNTRQPAHVFGNFEKSHKQEAGLQARAHEDQPVSVVLKYEGSPDSFCFPTKATLPSDVAAARIGEK
jgi:hypothetical protein